MNATSIAASDVERDADLKDADDLDAESKYKESSVKVGKEVVVFCCFLMAGNDVDFFQRCAQRQCERTCSNGSKHMHMHAGL